MSLLSFKLIYDLLDISHLPNGLLTGLVTTEDNFPNKPLTVTEVVWEPHYFATRLPRRLPMFTNITRPFSWDTWLCLALISLAVGIFMAILNLVHSEISEDVRETTLGDNIEMAYTMMVEVGHVNGFTHFASGNPMKKIINLRF